MRKQELNRIFLSYLESVLDTYKKTPTGYRYYINCKTPEQMQDVHYKLKQIMQEKDFIMFDMVINKTNKKIFMDFIRYGEFNTTFVIIFKDYRKEVN